jgi:hypothetical protein
MKALVRIRIMRGNECVKATATEIGSRFFEDVIFRWSKFMAEDQTLHIVIDCK